jgi:hypothetical protein
MRLANLIVLTFVLVGTPAAAQSSLTLSADPVPIVEAEINGRRVHLEVDLRLPDVLVLNPEAARRLGVRRVPLSSAEVGLDDALIRGRVARPRIVFAGAGATRSVTGIFNVPASHRADGLIGPGVLPYDVIRIELRAAQSGEREISFSLETADVWEPTARVGNLEVEISFDLANAASTFNRTAAALLDDAGAIVPDGAHSETPMLLGLRAQTQPVRTEITVVGLGLGPVVARTRSPLIGATDEETIVVRAEADVPPPSLWIGREALARCSSISVDRRSRRMSLRCAS